MIHTFFLIGLDKAHANALSQVYDNFEVAKNDADQLQFTVYRVCVPVSDGELQEHS